MARFSGARTDLSAIMGRFVGVFIIRLFWFDNPRVGRMFPLTWPWCEVGFVPHAHRTGIRGEQTFAGGGRAHACFLLGRQSEGGFPFGTDPSLPGHAPFAPPDRDHPRTRWHAFRQTAEPCAAAF